MSTHAWRSYERLDRVKWTRLAAAITFTSFVALFPLLTVAAAIGAATLSEDQQDELQDKLAEQVPGISDQLDIAGLVDNAGTIGLIAGALLLFTGIGWVGSMRECLRAVWEMPDEEENPVLRKAKDAGVLRRPRRRGPRLPRRLHPRLRDGRLGQPASSASTRAAGAASCCGSPRSWSPSSPTSCCCSTS